jgi:hypothetical protein
LTEPSSSSPQPVRDTACFAHPSDKDLKPIKLYAIID